MNPTMQITWEVLERAKDCGDATVIVACRRLIVANRSGALRRAAKADLALIREFYSA